jgi:hypothetical protein
MEAAMGGGRIELRRTNEVLRKASAFFAQAELDRRPEVIDFIEQRRGEYRVEPICGICRSPHPFATSTSRSAAIRSGERRWQNGAKCCASRFAAPTREFRRPLQCPEGVATASAKILP